MLSSRVVPVKRAWLHSSWGSRGRWGHLCQLPLQIYFWQGPTSSPCGSYGSLCGCIPSAGHIFSGTPPFTPFPSWWNGCQRGTFISVQLQVCEFSRGKATSSSCSQPPHSQRSPGSGSAVEDGGLVRALTKPALLRSCPYPATLILLLKFQVVCFPHPRAPALPAWRQI